MSTTHSATIIDSFLGNDLHTECSCGWEGEPVTAPTRAERRHLAMADWAAHAHVAAGLATPDDTTGETP